MVPALAGMVHRLDLMDQLALSGPRTRGDGPSPDCHRCFHVVGPAPAARSANIVANQASQFTNTHHLVAALAVVEAFDAVIDPGRRWQGNRR